MKPGARRQLFTKPRPEFIGSQSLPDPFQHKHLLIFNLPQAILLVFVFVDESLVFRAILLSCNNPGNLAALLVLKEPFFFINNDTRMLH